MTLRARAVQVSAAGDGPEAVVMGDLKPSDLSSKCYLVANRAQ